MKTLQLIRRDFLSLTGDIRIQTIAWAILSIEGGLIGSYLIDMKALTLIEVRNVVLLVSLFAPISYIHLKKLPQRKSAVVVMVILALEIVLQTLVYPVNKLIYTYATIMLAVPFTIAVNVFVIKYDGWIGKEYGSGMYETTQVLERIIFPLAGAVGVVISMTFISNGWSEYIIPFGGIVNAIGFNFLVQDYIRYRHQL